MLAENLSDRLNKLFTYNSAEGQLRHRNPRGGQPAGGIAGSVVKSGVNAGYVRVKVDSRMYCLHTLIWLLETGELLDRIDHSDGDRSNSTFSNLRPCTCQQNTANSKTRSDNRSGHRGVSFIALVGRYRARIKVDGKILSLGIFDTFDEAVAAYRSAADKHFGEYAQHNRRQT